MKVSQPLGGAQRSEANCPKKGIYQSDVWIVESEKQVAYDYARKEDREIQYYSKKPSRSFSHDVQRSSEEQSCSIVGNKKNYDPDEIVRKCLEENRIAEKECKIRQPDVNGRGKARPVVEAQTEDLE